MTFLKELVNQPRRLVLWYALVYVALSELYALLEHKGPIEGLWWGVVTGSTVGYGDSYPASTAGRGVGAILIFVSVAFVAMATAQLANHLLTDPNAWTHEEQEELKQNLAELTKLVENLSHQLEQQSSRRDEGDNS